MMFVDSVQCRYLGRVSGRTGRLEDRSRWCSDMNRMHTFKNSQSKEFGSSHEELKVLTSLPCIFAASHCHYWEDGTSRSSSVEVEWDLASIRILKMHHNDNVDAEPFLLIYPEIAGRRMMMMKPPLSQFLRRSTRLVSFF
jgi:hypothetical protein